MTLDEAIEKCNSCGFAVVRKGEIPIDTRMADALNEAWDAIEEAKKDIALGLDWLQEARNKMEGWV